MPGLLEAQRQAREAARQAKKDKQDDEDRAERRMRNLKKEEREKLAPYLQELDKLAKQYQGNPEALKVIAERRERIKRGYAVVTGRDVAEVPNSGEERATYQPQELSYATSGLKLPGLSDAELAAEKAKKAAETVARGQRRQARKEATYTKELDAALAERQVAEGRRESDDVLRAGGARAYTDAFDAEVVRSRNYPQAARVAERAREEYLRMHTPRVKAAAPVRPEQFTRQLPQVGVPAPPPPPPPGVFPQIQPALKRGVGYSLDQTLRGPGGLRENLENLASRVSALGNGGVPGAQPMNPMNPGPRARGLAGTGTGGFPGQKPGGYGGKERAPRLQDAPPSIGRPGAGELGVGEALERAAQLQGRPLTEAERWAVWERSRSRFT
jgi:hypothetical protein